MKKALLLSLALVCVASMAFAQGGTIGVYADAAGTNCYPLDVAPGLCTYHVVHTNIAGATASQFRAVTPACMFGVYLSDQQVFAVTVGSSQSGVAIGYGACLAGPIKVLGIQFFCQALTGPCCPFVVDAHPAALNVEAVDCGNNLLIANGSTTYVNGNVAGCTCTVGTEETTWGAVKSIYAE